MTRDEADAVMLRLQQKVAAIQKFTRDLKAYNAARDAELDRWREQLARQRRLIRALEVARDGDPNMN